ncbi:MAG: DNA repair exonuclease [Acidimicrobiia bacterium]
MLHCADLHIDATLGDNASFKQLENLTSREKELFSSAPLMALSKIGEIAVANSVNAIVMAGDLFDHRDSIINDARTRIAFRNFLELMQDNYIDVFIVLGNHDPVIRISELAKSWPDNTHVFPYSKPSSVEKDYTNNKVIFHGVSYETNEEKRNLASQFPARTDGAINIGILHTNIDPNSGHENYAPTSTQNLIDKKYEYFALGHVHTFETVNEYPHIVYSGNIQALSAKPTECTPKGINLVTIDSPNGNVETKFITTDLVRYLTLDIDVENTAIEDLANTISNKIMSSLPETNIFYVLRLNLNLDQETQLVDTSSIVELLNEQRDNYFVTQISTSDKSKTFDQLTNSHEFFKLLNIDLDEIEIGNLQDLYPKKFESISSIYTNNELENISKDDIKQEILSAYQKLMAAKS